MSKIINGSLGSVAVLVALCSFADIDAFLTFENDAIAVRPQDSQRPNPEGLGL